jgi:hypothetical protein
MFKEFKDVYPEFNELVSLVKKIVKEHDLEMDIAGKPDGQIAVQTNKADCNNWFAGVGKSDKKTPEWEHEFCHLQPLLQGTVIEDYLRWLEVPVYRARIMMSRSKSCYSIHKDYSPRLHLPLVTNTQCKFVFTNPAQLIHMPANGKTYWVDTRNEHTFMNGSHEARLHLVMIVE